MSLTTKQARLARVTAERIIQARKRGNYQDYFELKILGTRFGVPHNRDDQAGWLMRHVEIPAWRNIKRRMEAEDAEAQF